MWLIRLSNMLTGLPWWLSSKESTCQCLNVSDTGSVLGWKDPLGKEMATHSSILAWEIPQTEEPGRIEKSQTWLNNMLTQYFAVRTRKLVSMVYWLRCVCVCLCVRACTRVCVCVCSVPQSCLTLCNAMDCSLPSSSVHGISQARILEWVAISSPRGIFPNQGSNPHPLCLLHWQMGSLSLAPLVKPCGFPFTFVRQKHF